MPTKQQIEKLGNTLIYLSKGVGDFSKTKALKLLFLLEESSIKKYGIPFFGFDFQLWQFGPVEPMVYEEFETGLPKLSHFIKKISYNEFYEAVRDFDDDEFSNNDIGLMDEIIKFAKHKTASDIVDHTHAKGSLWELCAVDNNVIQDLESGELPRTNILIDFSKLFGNDEFLRERYAQSLENNALANFLNAV